jgi:ubiquinol-cytochrome c reductase cytochrome b subunit
MINNSGLSGLGLIFTILLVTTISCSDKGTEPAENIGIEISYSQDLQPIFDTTCAGCHVGGNQGGLRLNNYANLIQGGNSGPVVVAFEPDSSLLVQRIEGSITPQMPIGGSPLSQTDIESIRDWIAAGATDN